MGIKLDEKDMRLIGSLQKNARLTVSWLAEATGISRPTVMSKISRLREVGLLSLGAKTDFKVLNYRLASVNVRFDARQEAMKFASKMRSCPRVLQILESADESRYQILIYAEDTRTLISFIESLRKCIGNDFAWERVKAVYGSEFVLKVFEDKREKTPCGLDCSECGYYRSGECVACPCSQDYTSKPIEV